MSAYSANNNVMYSEGDWNPLSVGSFIPTAVADC